MEIESAQGSGTTVRIFLPRAASEVEKPAELVSPTRGNKSVILVVEDEPLVADIAARILEDEGYRVLTAQSGQEALDLSRAYEGAIDLMLTDVMMPGMRGTELAKKLLMERPAMKVVYMSGYTGSQLSDLALRPEEFLQKPFKQDTLLAAVHAWLKRPTLQIIPGAK
jgi:CheY-like chemotaxis protein